VCMCGICGMCLCVCMYGMCMVCVCVMCIVYMIYSVWCVVSISGGLGQHIRRPTRGVAEWVRGGEEKGWEGQWRRGDRLGGPGVPRRP